MTTNIIERAEKTAIKALTAQALLRRILLECEHKDVLTGERAPLDDETVELIRKVVSR